MIGATLVELECTSRLVARLVDANFWGEDTDEIGGQMAEAIDFLLDEIVP